jgi:hypothetical protein
MIQSNCSFCGIQFFAKNVQTKLCSDECRTNSRRATVAKSSEYIPRPKVETVCAECGKVFISKKAGTTMCSDICRQDRGSKVKQKRVYKNRKCVYCGIQCESKPGKPVCSNCRLDKRDPVKEAAKERRRRFRKYGITEDQYVQMLEVQGHVCAICQTSEPTAKGWQIDHCHSSMKVRGILCQHCNTALGSFSDDVSRLKSAIDYLKRFDV